MRYIDPKAKIFGHMPRVAAVFAGRRPSPVNVEIDLSNRCNLACEGCHFGYTHTRGPLAGKRIKPKIHAAGGDLMETGLAFRILQELAEADVKSVTWTGGGEPLTHPAASDIFHEAATLKIEQGIYTNGSLIDWKMAQLLKRVMEWVYISLDAADANAYRQMKVTDNFERVCLAVNTLANTPGKAVIGVGYLLTKYNYHQAEEMAQLGIERLGADYVQFRPLIRYDGEHPDRLAENVDWIDKAEPVLRRLAVLPKVELDVSRFLMYRDWRGHAYHTCWWSGLQAVITPNGKMWACVNKREYAAAEIGDLSRESFLDIWLRNNVEPVDADCRIMCRGHIPNQTLTALKSERKHANFI